MEDKPLPPVPVVQPSDAPDSLETPDGTRSVASYSLAPKNYPIESLEVHRPGDPIPGADQVVSAPTLMSVPFSRRRAMLVSLAVTGVVLLITGGVTAFFIKRKGPEPSTQLHAPTQDVSLEGGDFSEEIPPELQGAENALLLNGDLITRGKLKVVSGTFVVTVGSQALTVNQTITLPNASGVICLDSNNCNFATLAQLTQVAPVGGGVSILNGLAGDVTIQGSLNRISVAASNGIITLTTPQDLDANANVQFGGLKLNGLGSGPLRVVDGALTAGTINLGSADVSGTTAVSNGGTGTTTHTANGVLVGSGTNPITAVAAGGAGQCLMSTVSAPSFQACPGGGGGGVTSVNALTGALTLQGTANRINVVSGGATITLSTPQDINTTSDVTFDAMELTGYFHSSNSIDIDGPSVIGPGNSIVSSTPHTGTGLVVADTFVAGEDCTFACTAISAYAEKGSASAIFVDAIRAHVKVGDGQSLNTGAGLFVEGVGVGTGASLINGYGVYVSTQSAATNDYGVYVQHADTYGLWIDSGATRLDGTLEVQTLGATDTATYLCRNSLNQLAACGTTGAGVAYVQGGNNFGGTGTLGLTSNNDLNLITNNLTRLTVQNDGDVAFDTNTLFVDAVNNRVGIGDNTPSFALDVTGDTALVGHVSAGDTSAPNVATALSVGETFTSAENCAAFGCYGVLLNVTANNPSGVNDGVAGVYSTVNTAAAAFTLDRAVALAAGSGTLGAGSTITNNYGLYVDNQTAGVNDYGIYVLGADTYALWVDAGATRLDGTLELQSLGATNTANYLCRNSSNQLAACNTTGTGAAFVQGGNNFGGTGTLGLTSNNDLNLITNNLTRLTVQNDGDVAFDTNTLFVDAVNNRVGIGTATASDTLTVNGGIDIVPDGTLLEFGSGGTKTWALGPRDANNNFTMAYQGSEIIGFDNEGRISIGGGNPSARLEITNDLNQDAWGFNGIQIQVDSATYTDTSVSGTVTDAVFNSFGQPTLAATSATVTTNAATVYIQNSPTPGANQTITNAYSLWIDNGITRLDGNVGIKNTTAPNPLSLNTLTTADSTAQLAVSTSALGSKGVVVQGVASQSADLFQAQSSTGAVLASISAAGNLTVQNATINGHIITANSSGSTTVAHGAAANCSGTGSASVSGNDTAGTVTINTSTGVCAPGTLATVTFANAFGVAPRVILTPTNGNGATLQYYNGTTNTTTYTIDTGSAAATSTTYIYNYHVMQ